MPNLEGKGPVILEKKIFKSFECIFTFSQLSPHWERRGPSFKQTWIPFIQECSVPILVEVGPVVLEKNIFKIVQCICTISSLRKAWALIWTNLNSLHQICSVPSLVENGQVVLQKKMKTWKVYSRTDGRTDERMDIQTTDHRWSENHIQDIIYLNYLLFDGSLKNRCETSSISLINMPFTHAANHR